jgi:hypothetical protein
MPLSSQATASPSITQDFDRSKAEASTISGERRVRSLFRLYRAAHGRVLLGNNPKTIVLDLVQPTLAGGRMQGFGGKARCDEPGR